MKKKQCSLYDLAKLFAMWTWILGPVWNTVPALIQGKDNWEKNVIFFRILKFWLYVIPYENYVDYFLIVIDSLYYVL